MFNQRWNFAALPGIFTRSRHWSFPSWKLGFEPNMSGKPEVNTIIPIFVELILAMTVYFPVWYTAQEPSSLFWCHAVVNCLQFTHIHYIYLQRQFAKVGNGRSTIGLHCVTVTWQQIFKGSLQVAAIVFCHLQLLNAGILAGNAARQWLLIAVSQIVLYCVKRSKDAREQESVGSIFPCSFKRGRWCLFHYNIVGTFMVHQDRIETNLFQLFAQQENSVWFSIISFTIFEMNIVAEQKQIY